jgi:DNA phosphorothioation-associated putative methyltransferase
MLMGGKRVRGSIYLHIDTIRAQNADLANWLKTIAERAKANLGFNIVRIHSRKLEVSFLYYPGFRLDAHPSLLHSTSVAYEKWTVHHRDYSRSLNRPILHRKETFLATTDPDFKRFRSLTQAEESAGLLDEGEKIGYEHAWSQLLETMRYRIVEHELVHSQSN